MSKLETVRILTLQPFYGGSHRQFIDDWMQNSRWEWDCLTLPGRHWKWRMRQAAMEFAHQVDRMWTGGTRWDLILATDMMNTAEFRGLLRSGSRELPMLVYFHENQFAYPTQEVRSRDLHYAFTNMVSAVAANQNWFNSNYNRDSMLQGIETQAKLWPDRLPSACLANIVAKSNVYYPGVQIDAWAPPRIRHPVRIVWAARWEHDKNPTDLLRILEELDLLQIQFEISVIGQQFARLPPCFEAIQNKYGGQIRHWGYQSDRRKYWQVLLDSDVFISTAHHEFFGLSTVEAIAAGCIPVLPNRLSYPELLQIQQIPDRSSFLFGTVREAVAILQRMQAGNFDRAKCARFGQEFRNRFGWETRARALDFGIESFLFNHNTVAERHHC